MLIVDSLTYTYPSLTPGGQRITALDRVSLYVKAGQCLAVTGDNASGKTTLCLAAAGLAPRLTEGRIEQGAISVSGRDVQAKRPGALADVIGLVMQDPAGQLFNPTVADEIAWGLENLGVPPVDMEGRITEALSMVGLSHLDRDRFPHTLSGGEQKRLALASALALHPRVLILDEPSGGLSPSARTEMVETLRRLREESHLAILMAESSPDLLTALADRAVVLHEGRVAAEGTPQEILERRSTHRATPAQIQPPSVDACPAIELDHLTFAYDPARPILQDLNLTIPCGQFVALVGENGVGKTTLARHLIGLLRPDSGSVRILGEDTTALSVGQLAHRVGFAFQSPEVQIFNPTVREEIGFGPRNLGLSSAEIEAAVKEALAQFDLVDLADQPPAALSFSARRRVALASIAAMHTPILVLDEPTVGLDESGQAAALGWLNQRHRESATILLITHDMEIAAAAERVITLAPPSPPAPAPDKGQRRRSGLLYRLDPRVKLWIAFLALIGCFFTSDLPALAGLLIAAHAVLLLGGVPLRQVIRLWLALSPILAIILVLQPLLSPSGEIFGRIGPIRITIGGLETGGRYALRLGAAAFAVMIPIATTQTPDLVRGLVKAGMPYTLGMTVGLALHYLETVGGLYRSISEAQQARGWDLSERGLMKRARAAVPTLIAVIIASLRLSDALALGLAARGFGLGKLRTTYRDLQMTRLDWSILLITTLAFAAGVMLLIAQAPAGR